MAYFRPTGKITATSMTVGDSAGPEQIHVLVHLSRASRPKIRQRSWAASFRQAGTDLASWFRFEQRPSAEHPGDTAVEAIRKILVPTDFSAHPDEAFRVAHGLAGALGAEVILFHIARPPAVVSEGDRILIDPRDGKTTNLWDRFHSMVRQRPQGPRRVRGNHCRPAGNEAHSRNPG